MSAAKWEHVDFREFNADVDRANREPYKLEGHNFQPRRRLPWLVCKSCGLMRLRNKRTAWAEKHGCNYAKHPSYTAAMRAT